MTDDVGGSAAPVTNAAATIAAPGAPAPPSAMIAPSPAAWTTAATSSTQVPSPSIARAFHGAPRPVPSAGASSGIGGAAALACARAGATVALAARREDRIQQLAQRINDEGGRAWAHAADVGETDQARAFVEGAAAELGRLDVLVNNAGVMLLGPIAGAPLDEWRTMVHANVYGVLYCTHAALPVMQEQGSGHIVTVSSVAGRFARA